MTFDYLEPDRNATFEKAIEPHAREAHVQTLRERAAMLLRLGYSRDDIVRRLEQNVEWDFDMWAGKLPDFYQLIPTLVDELVGRHAKKDRR
jgi:hypothetical protein